MTTARAALTRDADRALRARAGAVIPGGMYGHQSLADLPDSFPQFLARAEGTEIWDADGNAYLDFMCGYGPMLLGYRHPAVEAAAAAQLAQADVQNAPSPRIVELAERFVELVSHADWAMFQKNGTDATTLCLTIARAETGRRKVLVAAGAYHGAAPWCTPGPAGVVEGDRLHLLRYRYNDLASVEAAAAEAGDDLAAILVSPFKHDLGVDQELAEPSFARGLRARCDRTGAALVLDDVRCGLRLSLGGSWEPLGVEPDLSAWSKAIANGYSLAAVLGGERFRDAAARVFTTGSFWFAGVAMAASLATLEVLREEGGVERMERIGQLLRDGLEQQARAHGVEIAQTGPPQMPWLRFSDDAGFDKAYLWTATALEHGVYLHPKHNWFLSAAHGERDVARALDATDVAFARVRERFGG